MLKIIEVEAREIEESQMAWSCGLWYGDFEEAGITRCLVLVDESNNLPVGFQSINIDGQTVAIEIKAEYQGKGLAKMLIGESGSYKPERNENKAFWDSVCE